MNRFKLVCQRLAGLFDADNIEIRNGVRLRLDLPRVIALFEPRDVTRVIYFKPEQFFSENARLFIASKGLEPRATYKNSDAWIICEAMALANKNDVIAFVGVDADLEPVILMLKSQGVRVEGYAWPEKISPFMRRILDKFTPLTEDLILGDYEALNKPA